MAPEKETLMVLKVDLECHRCYTRVKRALCSLPQIQDQIYKEKQNAVMIKVVCCSPDKIRDKLLSKAGKSIKAIEILEPPKKPAADKPTSKPAEENPKPPSKPKEMKEGSQTPAAKPPPQADNNKPPAADKIKKNGSSKPQGDAPPPAQAQSAPPGKPAGEPKKPTDQAAAAMMYMQPSELIHCYPGYPVNMPSFDSYDARMSYPPAGFGPYYGAPPPPPPPQYGYGHNPGYCVTRYEDYVSDENATGCVVM